MKQKQKYCRYGLCSHCNQGCERQKQNSSPQGAPSPFAHSTELSGKLSRFKLMLFLWVTLHYQTCNSMSLVLLIAGLGIMHFMWTLLLNPLEVAIYIPFVGCPMLTSLLCITLLWKSDPVTHSLCDILSSVLTLFFKHTACSHFFIYLYAQGNSRAVL